MTKALIVALLAPLVAAIGISANRPAISKVPGERGPLATAQALFDAMAARDTEAAKHLVLPGTVFLGTQRTPEGPRVQRLAFQDWLLLMDSMEVDVLEAFEGEPSVHVSGDIAMVWGAYRLELGGELQHTGIDALTLLRTQTESGETWRIAGIAFTTIPARDE